MEVLLWDSETTGTVLHVPGKNFGNRMKKLTVFFPVFRIRNQWNPDPDPSYFLTQSENNISFF